ncbi:MAG: ATP-binding protein, partial [Pseudobdellovibrionaceae bacterium]
SRWKMEDFKRTQSISRKLVGTLVLISVFFLVEFAGLYLSSQSFLDGLASLYQINQSYEQLENVRKIVNSIEDTVRQRDDFFIAPDASTIFAVAAERAQTHLSQSMNLEHINDQVVIDLIHQAQNSFADLLNVVLNKQNEKKNLTAQRFIALQYALETRELLNKAQLELSASSDRIFSQLYENRFRPLIISLLLALLLLLTALFLGLRISKHIDASLKNLLRATSAVSSGDLNYRVPVLAPDELGYLTDEFNKMTEILNKSTVSRNFVESIIESMFDGVLVLDSSGLILRANKVTSDVFGYELNELIGHPLATLIPTRIPTTTKRTALESIGLTKSGQQIPISISLSPLESQKGSSGVQVCVIRDITDLKESEKQLKNRNMELANANRELEAFSYSVSHDLRAPLRSVDGFSLALLEDSGEELNEKSRDYLTRIRAAVQKMGKLIDDLLNLSRITRAGLRPSKTNLTQMALEISENLKSENPARQVEFIVQDRLEVFADPALMRVVLENLLGNAWKYTSKHSTARIEFGATTRNNEKPTFFVRDDGAGFNVAYAKKLFGAFQRLHTDAEFPGTGVGLATVQRIVHRHGGTIWTEAEVEKGSTFYFSL